MTKYEDRCCGCATETYPCLGSRCPNMGVEVLYCYICGCEIGGDVYDVDGEDLCEECLKDMFRREL